ncbi:GIY-YIG nuclease family protein [Dermacoccus sp. PE3]|uniref:GIY-YIG nuclease family protein n=1 Tax=Dermacoccus sp. PE3 TaxID=1641401 RepID=UPI000B13A1CF|nr:GIY-YIG nuclease family protein [Dermacoccus sp. PE3]
MADRGNEASKKSTKPKKPRKPTRKSLPARDVQEFRENLAKLLSVKDDEGRKWADARWGVYAFYDYEGEPIYVGQSNEQLRVRVQRHLTNQRTDAVAMRILDLFEVAEVALWPLWEYEEVKKPRSNSEDQEASARYKAAIAHLNALEYSVYLDSIENSRFKAILNEKIPPVSERIALPASLRRDVISQEMREERGHEDIRIERRAETISRLASVARERGEVSDGLRRVLVIQAVRLAYLASTRLAQVEGRELPSPDVIDMEALVGSVLVELSDPTGAKEDANDASLGDESDGDDPDAA